MNLFVFPEIDIDGVYFLIAETGEVLASHYCSGNYWAKDDLEGRRPERQKEWKERFGDYKVLFLSEQTEEPKITEEELIARNEKWEKENSSENEEALQKEQSN